MTRALCSALILASCTLIAHARSEPEPTPPGARAAAPAGEAPAMTPEQAAADRDRLMNEVLKSIAGHEQEPSEKVFKNVQVFKGVPAGRLPMIMNMGFGRSLGVTCTHCHVSGEWEKDEKPTKQIAREMMGLSRKISSELLPAIKNLKSEKPAVNCTTCHRGQVKPALEMPEATPPPAGAR
jgi:hypothetical protein